MRRIVVVLGVAALMVALIAGPVAARAEVTHEVIEGSYPDPETGNTATLYITCGPYAGEYALSYDYKIPVTTVTKPNGEQMYSVHYINFTGQAVNAETGRTFYFHDVNNQIYQAENTQVAATSLLVTRGGEFNFFAHSTVRLDENGEPVFEHIQTRDNCSI